MQGARSVDLESEETERACGDMRDRADFGAVSAGVWLSTAALAASLVGCSSSTGPGATPTVTETSRVTITEAPPQSVVTSPGVPSDGSDSSPGASPAVESWIMPNEIGKSLQTAQDDLQALTGNPAFVSTSEDLTGEGRQQIMDRNWQVCSSTPPPGASFTSQTNVIFGVVRDSERCP